MIRVNDDWVIMVDPYCYVPHKDMHRTRMDKQKDGTYAEVHDYKSIGRYFADIRGAVEGIARYEINQELAKQDMTLPEAIKLIDDTFARFEKSLERIQA